MAELRRNYSFVEKAATRFSSGAPNLCGMDSFTHGEQAEATAEVLTLAINHGPKEPILVARDVLCFVGRAEDYKKDWGDRAAPSSRLLSCMIDATPEEIEAAADFLVQAWKDRTKRSNVED